MLSVAQGKGIDAKIIKPQWNGPSQVWDVLLGFPAMSMVAPTAAWGGVA